PEHVVLVVLLDERVAVFAFVRRGLGLVNDPRLARAADALPFGRLAELAALPADEVLVPLDAVRAVRVAPAQHLVVLTVRARYVVAALVGLQPRTLDRALALDRRRRRDDAFPAPERRGAPKRERDRIALGPRRDGIPVD